MSGLSQSVGASPLRGAKDSHHYTYIQTYIHTYIHTRTRFEKAANAVRREGASGMDAVVISLRS